MRRLPFRTPRNTRHGLVPHPVLFPPVNPLRRNPWLSLPQAVCKASIPFPTGPQKQSGCRSCLCPRGRQSPAKTVGGWRAKPQCRPLGFCGFQPGPRCYFSATPVFNLRICVDQKEGPKHYFFSLGQAIKFEVLKNAQPGPKLCPIGK